MTAFVILAPIGVVFGVFVVAWLERDEVPPSQEREDGHGAQADDGHPTSSATPRAPGATEKP